MLANHHDCGAPMFRYQGKVVCPVCDFQERKQEQQPQQEESEKRRKKIEEQQIGQGQINRASPGISGSSSQPALQISNIIANQIRNLTASLETETELGRTKDKMECIERGVRILKLLREMD